MARRKMGWIVLALALALVPLMGAGPGGVIIERGAVAPPPGILTPNAPLDATDLPVVNTGFADDQDVAGEIGPVVEMLRSADYEKRVEATEALMRLPPGRLEDVKKALAEERDPEAIARLKEVAAHLFLKPRTVLFRPSLLGTWFKGEVISLLGVSFAPEPVRLDPKDANLSMTIAVTQIQPGFPAAQRLRVGDRILGINGQKFPDTMSAADFPPIIRQYWPGTMVRLSVLRQGKVMEITVQMAGIATEEEDNLGVAIAVRNGALEAFLKTLKTGRKEQGDAVEDQAQK